MLTRAVPETNVCGLVWWYQYTFQSRRPEASLLLSYSFWSTWNRIAEFVWQSWQVVRTKEACFAFHRFSHFLLSPAYWFPHRSPSICSAIHSFLQVSQCALVSLPVCVCVWSTERGFDGQDSVERSHSTRMCVWSHINIPLLGRTQWLCFGEYQCDSPLSPDVTFSVFLSFNWSLSLHHILLLLSFSLPLSPVLALHFL